MEEDVQQVMPKAWFKNLSFDELEPVSDEKGSGYVVLPDDFLSINRIQDARMEKIGV